ncbi:hypothetical protein ACFL0X_02390 [Nanoarchaeota archaeon]
MVNITLKVSEDLKQELQAHKEVNWSAVIRRALAEHLNKIKIANTIASKSQLTEDDVRELSEKIKSRAAVRFNEFSN